MTSMTQDDRLPRDAQSILELAARSMFDLFANASEGMMLVDRKSRVVWINDQYRRFLPAIPQRLPVWVNWSSTFAPCTSPTGT